MSSISFIKLLDELKITQTIFPKPMCHYDGIRIESALHYIFDAFVPVINPQQYEDKFPVIFEKYDNAAEVILDIYIKKKISLSFFFQKFSKFLTKPFTSQKLQTLNNENLSIFIQYNYYIINKKFILLLISRDFIDEVEDIYEKNNNILYMYLEEFIEHALFNKNISLLIFFFEQMQDKENYNPWSLHHFNEFENYKYNDISKGEFVWKLCYEYLVSHGKHMKTRDVSRWLKYMKNKNDVLHVFNVFFRWEKPTVKEFITIFSKHVNSYDSLNLLINKYYTSEEIIKSMIQKHH
jgi:hypothetical protein